MGTATVARSSCTCTCFLHRSVHIVIRLLEVAYAWCLKRSIATWAPSSYKHWKNTMSENSLKDYETGCRRVPVKQVEATKQMMTTLLPSGLPDISLCIWTVSIPLFYFTSKKQRDNEIWCSLHNARIFSLWIALEPQQDVRQHLLHTCLHQLNL